MRTVSFISAICVSSQLLIQELERHVVKVLHAVGQRVLIEPVARVVVWPVAALFRTAGAELHEETGAVFKKRIEVLSRHDGANVVDMLLAEAGKQRLLRKGGERFIVEHGGIAGIPNVVIACAGARGDAGGDFSDQRFDAFAHGGSAPRR